MRTDGPGCSVDVRGPSSGIQRISILGIPGDTGESAEEPAEEGRREEGNPAALGSRCRVEKAN